MTEINLNYILKTQVVPFSKHTPSWLRKRVRSWCIVKQPPFVLRSTQKFALWV